MRAKHIANLAILVALAVTVGFMITAGRSSGARISGPASNVDLSLVLFAVWAALPYIGAFLVVRTIGRMRVAEGIALAATLLVCALGPALVVATMMGLGGAQGGLGFLFLPFLQLAAVGLIAIALAVARRRRPV